MLKLLLQLAGSCETVAKKCRNLCYWLAVPTHVLSFNNDTADMISTLQVAATKILKILVLVAALLYILLVGSGKNISFTLGLAIIKP